MKHKIFATSILSMGLAFSVIGSTVSAIPLIPSNPRHAIDAEELESMFAETRIPQFNIRITLNGQVGNMIPFAPGADNALGAANTVTRIIGFPGEQFTGLNLQGVNFDLIRNALRNVLLPYFANGNIPNGQSFDIVIDGENIQINVQ